jgi:hypothetical protein
MARKGKPKAGGDGCFLYCATADDWGVRLWGHDHALRVGEGPGAAVGGSGRVARAQGRRVRAGGGVGMPLGRVPARTGESRADGWALLQSQVVRATDIWAPATVLGFEFPKPVNFIQI